MYWVLSIKQFFNAVSLSEPAVKNPHDIPHHTIKFNTNFIDIFNNEFQKSEPDGIPLNVDNAPLCF